MPFCKSWTLTSPTVCNIHTCNLSCSQIIDSAFSCLWGWFVSASSTTHLRINSSIKSGLLTNKLKSRFRRIQKKLRLNQNILTAWNWKKSVLKLTRPFLLCSLSYKSNLTTFWQTPWIVTNLCRDTTGRRSSAGRMPGHISIRFNHMARRWAGNRVHWAPNSSGISPQRKWATFLELRRSNLSLQISRDSSSWTKNWIWIVTTNNWLRRPKKSHQEYLDRIRPSKLTTQSYICHESAQSSWEKTSWCHGRMTIQRPVETWFAPNRQAPWLLVKVRCIES